MKHCLLLGLFLLCGLTLAARDIYMVSVGISDYKYINDLTKAENDARTMAELYRTHTVKVKELLGSHATHDSILATLRSFYAAAKEDDIVVFFFSGHGAKGGLCAYDTQHGKNQVTYEELQSVFRQCKSNNKQLFIDACYAGGLRSDTTSAAKSSSRPPSLLSDTEGVMLFLSSRTQEVSRENRWSNNGFFTQYLIKGLKGAADSNADRIITAKEIYTYVSVKVAERTQKKQNPVMWGKFNDNMHIMNWNVFVKPSAEGKPAFTMPRRENDSCEKN